MISRINSDGTVQYTIPEMVNQGSDLANAITIIAPFSKSISATITYTLPQGTRTQPLQMTPYEFSSDDTLNLWSINVDSAITQYAGTVNYVIKFINERVSPTVTLATVNFAFLVNKTNVSELPAEPTEEVYQQIQDNIAELYTRKVDRIDVNDIPTGITYSADGLKTRNVIYYNAAFTIGEASVVGTLLVVANSVTSVTVPFLTIYQKEYLFTKDATYTRLVTDTDSTITLTDWQNYDLFAEVSTLQTIAKKVDIYPTTNEHIVDNMFEYDIIVPNNITLSDIQTNGLNLMLTNGSAFNDPNYKKIVIKKENGEYIINTFLTLWFANGYNALKHYNPTGCLVQDGTILHYVLIYDIDYPNDSYFVTYDRPYGTADASHDGLLRNIDFAKIQNALLKTAQTLTTGEKTQAKTNLDLQNVDNTSDLNKPISTAMQTALNDKINLTEKAAVNGVATLDSTGKIPSDQLPPIAITNTFVVNSQVEMLALDAQVGDIAVRTDLNQSFILQTADPSILGHWQVLLMPTDTVLSVAGKTGIVTLNKDDVGLNNVDNTSDLNKPVSTATQIELNKKATRLTFANTTVQTTDFVADTTYSNVGFKASIALSGVLATDNADLYFDGTTINTTITDSNAFMAESYAGGIYLYSKVVPSTTVTISTIEIRR